MIPFVVSLIAYVVVKGVLSQESNNLYIQMILAGCLAIVANVRRESAEAKLLQDAHA